MIRLYSAQPSGVADVDLVVVLAPGHMDANALLRPIKQEGADTFDQGVRFGHVEDRVLSQVAPVIGDLFPFRNGLGRDDDPERADEAEAKPVGGEGAVFRFPLHVRGIGGRDGRAREGHDVERVLEKEEEAERGRRSRPAESGDGPEAAFGELQLLPGRRVQRRGQGPDLADVKDGARPGLDEDLLGQKGPARLELINGPDGISAGVESERQPALFDFERAAGAGGLKGPPVDR